MLHAVMLVGHVLGAGLLAAGLGIEGTVLRRLQQPASRDDAVAALRDLTVVQRLYPTAWLLLVGCGSYLAVSRWGWQGWIVVSLVATLALPVLGATVAGPRLRRRAAALLDDADHCPPDDQALGQDAVLVLVYRLRLGIVASVVWMMVVKPGLGGSLLSLASLLIVAAGSSAWAHRRQARRSLLGQGI